MKVIGLISGGKDGCYNLIRCLQLGHEIVALAHLKPPNGIDEIDSFMYQSVGYEVVRALSEAMNLPLIENFITGKPLQQTLQYEISSDKNHLESVSDYDSSEDEVENLFNLLKEGKSRFPEVKGVASGAIQSNYQRLRIENVCSRLGFTSLAFLWQSDQESLLKEMIDFGMEAILIKIAAFGLTEAFLGCSIQELCPQLCKLSTTMDLNPCGEGGEYESLTLYCPILFRKRVVLDKVEKRIHSEDAFSPVVFLKILSYHLEEVQPRVTSHLLPKHDWICRRIRDDSLWNQWKKNNQKPYFLVSKLLSKSTRAFDFQSECFISFKADAFGIGFRNFPKDYCLDTISIEEQVRLALSHAKDQLCLYGMNMSDVFFINIFLKGMKDFSKMNDAYCSFFESNPPSRTCISPMNISSENSSIFCGSVKLECFAVRPTVPRTVLHVQSVSYWAPACIGPYSQAQTIGKLVFLAGQIGLDPARMELVSKDDPIAQLLIIVKNIRNVLKTVGSHFDGILFSTIYVTSPFISHLKALQRVWIESFDLSISKIPPVTWIEVHALPREASVEVQLVSLLDNVTNSAISIEISQEEIYLERKEEIEHLLEDDSYSLTIEQSSANNEYIYVSAFTTISIRGESEGVVVVVAEEELEKTIETIADRIFEHLWAKCLTGKEPQKFDISIDTDQLLYEKDSMALIYARNSFTLNSLPREKDISVPTSNTTTKRRASQVDICIEILVTSIDKDN